jgi:hypothetical protein
MDIAPCVASLDGQILEKSENLELIAPPIQLVAALHYHELATDPLVLFVDRPGDAQRGTGCGEITVKISQRHQPLGLWKSRRNVEIQRT